jgi:hypothetical protein
MDSHEKKIVAAIYDRLGAILIAEGFNTDAGLKRYRGRVNFDEHFGFPVVTVVEQDSELQERLAARSRIALTVSVEGICESDPDNPSDAAHDLVADIESAVLSQANPNLSGLVVDRLEWQSRTILERAEGANQVMVSVRFTCVYIKWYGEPYK